MTNVPRVDEPSLFDEPGMVNTLQVTLVAMLTSALAISALTLFLRWRHTPQLALVSAASCLVALVLSRLGRMRSAMLLPLLSITYAILHLAARSDGMQNIGLAILPVLIMLGGLVLERLTLVFFTATEILAVVAMLAIRYFVLQAERYSRNDMGDLFILALTCATAALVGRLLAVRIEDSFRLVRNSESRYRRMFDSIQDVYFEMFTDGTLLELSPAGAGLFGVAREEMIGRSMVPFCANQSEFDGFRAVLLEQGRVSNHELVIRNSRAALVHVLVNASLQKGNATAEDRLIGSIRDITERRRAEEALRESEARLRLALDATGAGTFDFYPQSNQVIWSEITKSHFGMSPATEVDHDMFLAAVHPHDRDRIRQLGSSMAPPGGERQLATEYRTIGVEDGRERWIAVRGRMLFDEENRATRLIGTTLDITARKRAEEELIASENRYRTLFEAANDAIFLHGVKPDGTPDAFVAVNQVAEQRLGFSAEEFTALTPVDIDEEGYEEERRRALEMIRKQGSVTFEMVHVAKDGRRIPVEISSRQFTADGRTWVLSIARDMTERKRAERELRESEERFRSLSAAALEGIMVHSQGVILDANAQFVRLFGYESAEELIGRNGLEFMVTPESAVRLRRRMQELDAGPFEITGIRKDGSTFSAETDSRPLQYRGHAAIIVSCRDISERKRAEAEQEKLRTQLAQAQKMESIGRLAGGVAHDFNNLLTVINGYSQLLLAKLRPGDQSREPLEQILAAGEHAAELTRQLLAFSRKQVLQSCVLDLNRVTRALRPMLQRLVGEDIEVRLALGTDSPVVQADPHQLEQVILNLAVNSRDAMPKGGSLLIETSLVELDAGFAKLHPQTHPGRYAMLAVSDTGIGMDEATRQRIFDPFFTTKPVGQGTGLGLSMVQGIVAQSGGYIEVHSEPGRGTTFKIYLPVLAGARSEEERPPAAAALRGNETILVVEDQAEVRDYGVAVLKEYGYRVIAAVNAGDAQSICERERGRIHLLLADVVMPDTSGPELAARLVKMRPGIKVLFMSGYTDGVIGHHGVLDKDAHFLQKPFTPEELATKVRVVLGPPTPPDSIAVSEQ